MTVVRHSTQSNFTKGLQMKWILPLALSSTLFAGTYTLDTAHSSVGFKIKHMMIANVNGSFNQFNGSFEYDEKAHTLKTLEGTVEVASINTANEKRDDHLRSAELFNASSFPKMMFTLHNVKNGKAKGDLTIRGITKSITFDLEDNGMATDPWGNDRVGLELTGKINRKDFGITWNKTLESGGVLVGEEVKLEIILQGIAQ